MLLVIWIQAVHIAQFHIGLLVGSLFLIRLQSAIEIFFFPFILRFVKVNSCAYTVYAITFTFDWMHWIDTYPKISQLVKQTNKPT